MTAVLLLETFFSFLDRRFVRDCSSLRFLVFMCCRDDGAVIVFVFVFAAADCGVIDVAIGARARFLKKVGICLAKDDLIFDPFLFDID